MNVSRRIVALGLLAVLLAACADLEVENPNEPDRERALATPGDVEALIAGSFVTWFRVDQGLTSAGPVLSVMADECTSLSCYGRRDFCQEPRQAIRNDPSYLPRIVEFPWFRSYAAIAAVRDGLIVIAGRDGELFTDDDMEIGDGGADTPRAIALAKFVQGLAHGYLGMLYDRAFIVDETSDPWEMDLTDVKPYGEVIDAAVGYLQEAIEIASQYPFAIPPDWVGDGGALTDNADLLRLAHSYIARILAGAPRTVAERDAVDWGAVLSHANAGIIEDFWVMGDGGFKWYSGFKWLNQQLGWARTDLRMVGPAGSTVESNQRWRDWEALPPHERLPFDVDTDDARMPTYPPVIAEGWDCVSVTERTASCGRYFEYRDPYRPWYSFLGTYHFSGYADYRHHEYVDDEIGPIAMFNVAENDMLKAEALIRLGRDAEAVPLINTYRAGNGRLPHANVSGVPEVDGRCTPRTVDGSCADLFEAMKYEKRMEVYVTGMGVAFWDDRGWGDLLSRTAVHFPIPAKELMVLLEEIYTFGGGGPGSAPDKVAWSVAAGDGLKPLSPGEVVSDEDIAARVRLFETINEAARAPRFLDCR